MQFVILGMLLAEPLSLYDIRRRFESIVSLFYSASFGSIQRALALLVDQEQATVADDPASARRRRLYRVTPAGRAAWHEWMRAPVTGADAEKIMLAKVFFLGHLADVDDRRAVVATLRARIDADLLRLRELGASVPAPADGDPVLASQLAALDYGQRSTELARAWLRQLEKAVAG